VTPVDAYICGVIVGAIVVATLYVFISLIVAAIRDADK
jgi:hypothetical protein